MNNNETMIKINEKSLTLLGCIQSLEFILRDLEDMEITANSTTDNRYLGLSNIIEQLAYRMKAEVRDIMKLSD